MIEINQIKIGTKLTFRDNINARFRSYSGQTMTVDSITINEAYPEESVITLKEDEQNLHWYPKAFERIEYDVSLLDMLASTLDKEDYVFFHSINRMFNQRQGVLK